MGKQKLIAFVAYPGVSPLDLVGPLTVLRDLKLGTPYRTVVVAADTSMLPSDTPMGIVPARSFADVPNPFAVFVPGGGPAAVEAMRNEAVLEYVRMVGANAQIVGSTGNGALVLGAAGLLRGRRVASHWAYRDLVESTGAVLATDRWVDDGRVLTAAGGTAGIDAMLHLTERLRGKSAARLAQLWMEYDPEPPFGRPDPADPAGQLGAGLLARPFGRPPEAALDASSVRSARKEIAVVLYPGVTALDLVGPLQVLAELERSIQGFRTVVVGETLEPMGTDVGMSLVATNTFADVPKPAVVVVPGGRAGTIRALSDPAIRAYVRTAAASADVVASVCTGSLILASVGLLDGRRAPTNWAFASVLERLGGRYVRARWLHEGNLVMSAGVSAGIDMALYLASNLADEVAAKRIQQVIDYDPQPPGGRIDWPHLPLTARAARGAISAAAPFIAVKPRLLTRADRRAGNVIEHAL